jgi:hypothetical protein
MPANLRDLMDPEYAARMSGTPAELYTIVFWRLIVPCFAILLLVFNLIRVTVLIASGHLTGITIMFEPWVL